MYQNKDYLLHMTTDFQQLLNDQPQLADFIARLEFNPNSPLFIPNDNCVKKYERVCEKLAEEESQLPGKIRRKLQRVAGVATLDSKTSANKGNFGYVPKRIGTPLLGLPINVKREIVNKRLRSIEPLKKNDISTPEKGFFAFLLFFKKN